MSHYLLQSILLQGLLGDIEPLFFLWCAFWACIGVIITLLAGTMVRDPESKCSPRKWSFLYLIRDNYKRIIWNAVLIFIAIRFYEDITGWALTHWSALCIGLSFDTILMIIKQKSSWLDPSKKAISKQPPQPSDNGKSSNE